MEPQPYDKRFFADQVRAASKSAATVVPAVKELVAPRSVIDVGCGLGVWLRAFAQHGIEDICGVDGEYAREHGRVEIPEGRFVAWDLTQPLALGRTFDLVVSLEVAEHLPEICAEAFVDTLTRLGPVVLFSAAIPYQGGTHHINEQWPDYWAARFRTKGYLAVDCLRRRFWDDPNVSWWYAQNMLFFVREDVLPNYPLLHADYRANPKMPLRLVHWERYVQWASWRTPETSWRGRIQALEQALGQEVPPGSGLIVVDDEQLALELHGLEVVPFLERYGTYWGAPVDDAEGIAELERLHVAGKRFIAFTWPSFWWFDHYLGFARYLDARYRRVVSNEDLVLFDLERPPAEGSTQRDSGLTI